MFFKLKHRKVVPSSMIEFANMLDSGRRVRLTMVGNIKISTVFLGVDHSHNRVSQFFETMLFSADKDYSYQTRCETHRQALAMHREAVRMVKDDCYS
jgi:hypothetical protein